MRVLITGIAGFAGSYLAKYILDEKKAEIFGIDLPGCSRKNLVDFGNRIKLYACNICNSNSVLRAMKTVKPDLIFHLAAQAFIPDSWLNPGKSLNTNIIGELTLLEAVRKLRLDTKIHIACSAEEYGLVYPDEVPVKETNPFRPLSPYAVGKLTQDMLGYQYYRSYGMFIVRTRAFNHIGPRMSERFVVANFARQIALIEKRKQRPIICVGNLEPVRDFTDVKDVAQAYWLSLERGKPGDVYNICSDKGNKIKKILEILMSFTSNKIKIKQERSRFRPSDIMVLVGDSSRFRKQTGWKPKIPLENSLRDILNYWRENT